MYRLATKRARKKRVEENASLSFLDTIRRALQALVVLSSVIRSLGKLCSVTLEWAPHVRTLPSGYTQTPGGCVHKPYPKESGCIYQPNVCTCLGDSASSIGLAAGCFCPDADGSIILSSSIRRFRPRPIAPQHQFLRPPPRRQFLPQSAVLRSHVVA